MTISELIIDEQLPDWLRTALKEGHPVEVDGNVELQEIADGGIKLGFYTFSYYENGNLRIDVKLKNEK